MFCNLWSSTAKYDSIQDKKEFPVKMISSFLAACSGRRVRSRARTCCKDHSSQLACEQPLIPKQEVEEVVAAGRKFVQENRLVAGLMDALDVYRGSSDVKVCSKALWELQEFIKWVKSLETASKINHTSLQMFILSTQRSFITKEIVLEVWASKHPPFAFSAAFIFQHNTTEIKHLQEEEEWKQMSCDTADSWILVLSADALSDQKMQLLVSRLKKRTCNHPHSLFSDFAS